MTTVSDILSSLTSYGTSGTSTLQKLVDAYTASAKQSVSDLEEKKDSLTVTSGMFTDLKSKISAVSDAAGALTGGSLSVFGQNSATSSDSGIVTATASSSASAGTYLLENIVLAKANRMVGGAASGWTAANDGSFTVNGQTISVTAGQTLSDVRNAINSASYDTGKGVVATIVGGKLVLEGEATGDGNNISLSEVSGGILAGLNFTSQQDASNATFKVNGIDISTASNSNLTGVVSGLTISLVGAGTSAKLTVAPDTASMTTKINDFLTKLNSLTDYISTKSAITEGSDGTYTRGALNGYSLYTSLKGTLSTDVSMSVSGLPSGSATMLSSLGITLDSSLHYVVSDSSKLSAALQSDPDGVSRLFGGTDGIATRVVNRLKPYLQAGSGYLAEEQDAITSRRDNLDDQITRAKERLAAQQVIYERKFTNLIESLTTAAQLSTQLSSLFSATSDLTS